MARLIDVGVSAVINIGIAFVFIMLFSFLRLQPFNDRVYFPKLYKKGLRKDPKQGRSSVRKYINLDFIAYFKFFNWTIKAFRISEAELIDYAGLDSAVYIRIYLIGIKIFTPIALMAWAVLVPINWTSTGLEDINSSDIDKLSVSNVESQSARFWGHILMAYVFTFWTCYVLMKEYEKVASLRLNFLAAEKRRADHYTVLVRNIPPDPDESVSEHVERFFRINHPDHYLTHQIVYNANKLAKLVEKRNELQNWLVFYQNKLERKSKRPEIKTGFLGLWGKKLDAIDHYTSQIDSVSEEIDIEKETVTNDPKSIMPVAFVSFKTRWAAAVCAQTQQTRNPTLWLTQGAPEPQDVFWKNLPIPYVSLTVRRLIAAVAFFFLTFFFMIPIAFVQTLASIDGIEKVAPWMKRLTSIPFIHSFVQGFLPGAVLKLFLIFLPRILMAMSKFEGFESVSSLERRTASRYYLFNFVNVFLGNILTGTAFQQLNSFLHEPANRYPKIIGSAIPLKASFFITFIMVDGWSGVAAEILQLKQLFIYHMKNFFIVKTEKDREEAMDPGSIAFNKAEPRIQLYFLLGLVYAAVTPAVLPFIIIFFAMAFVVFRHQIINVYNPKYESGAAFWPDVHFRIILALIVSQVVLMGLLATKKATASTPFIIVLPVLTIWFHWYCNGRFKPAFAKFPLQEAMMKDTLEQAKEPDLNLNDYLKNAYAHPIFQDIMEYEEEEEERLSMELESGTVSSKRQSRSNTLLPNGASSPSLPDGIQNLPKDDKSNEEKTIKKKKNRKN